MFCVLAIADFFSELHIFQWAG